MLFIEEDLFFIAGLKCISLEQVLGADLMAQGEKTLASKPEKSDPIW